MKRTVWLWELFGFAVTALGGTLLHFLYDWIESPWVAAFSGVNESTWEHMKLLFWPTFIYAVFESIYFKSYVSFQCVKLRGMLIGLCAIPVMFYTYNGVIGRSPDWVNIAIFFVAAAMIYAYETYALNRGRIRCKSPKLAFTVMCIIGLMFVIFTFKTPEISIFKDPITSTYGI